MGDHDAIKPTVQPGGFYGPSRRKHVLLQKSIESHVAAKKSRPVPVASTRIGGPVPFMQQQDAFSYAQSQSGTGQTLHVFAYDCDEVTDGHEQHMYLAMSYPVFWQYYQHLHPSQRRHYEIIPEGAVCKLYFDLEFVTEFNHSRNGSQMTQIFIKFVSACLKQFFSVDCASQYIVDLDDSTSCKFHRHLIYNVPNIAFKDNSHVGNFIRYIFTSVLNRVHHQHEEPQSGNKSCNCMNTSRTQVKEQGVCSTVLNDEQNKTCDSVNQDQCTKWQSQHNNSTTPQKCARWTSSEHTHSENGQLIVRSSNYRNEILPGESGDTEDGPSLDRKMAAVLDEFTLEELQSLIVHDEKGGQVLFCDMGVYSENRYFRLYLSRRSVKDNPLHLSSPGRYNATGKSPKEKRQQIEKPVFFDSLVTSVSHTDDLRILTFADVSHLSPPGKSSSSSHLHADVLPSVSSSDNAQLSEGFEDLDDQWLVEAAEEAEVHYGTDCLSDEELLEAVNEAEQNAMFHLTE